MGLLRLWQVYELDQCYFQHGKSTCHVERFTLDWYDDNEVNRLDWPSQSPDFNPAENIRDLLDSRIKEGTNRSKIRETT
ncbi:hypothetical protein TNCT_369171 [Trichonephila clavata]|uniref:Uncharacterized protein n=1 Tax=Trichonephila clavata TaxID=2740835 RepID=A0A8X6IE83_TRICU|nr:hypothetical protein TNCT_369171 [Trichonephila clavata]